MLCILLTAFFFHTYKNGEIHFMSFIELGQTSQGKKKYVAPDICIKVFHNIVHRKKIIITKSYSKISAKIKRTTKQNSKHCNLGWISKIYYINARILISNTYCFSCTNIRTKVCKDSEGC